MSDIPKVFAQATKENRRIASLLSATLLRQVHRRQFLEDQTSSFLNASPKALLGRRSDRIVVIVQPTRREQTTYSFLIPRLVSSIRKASRWLVVEIPVEHGVDDLQPFLSLLRAMQKSKTTVVGVAMGEVANWMVDLLNSLNESERSVLLAIALLFPTRENISVSIPALVFSNSSSASDACVSSDILASVRSNPSVLWATISPGQRETETHWLVKTILLYFNAIDSTTLRGSRL